MSDVTITIDTQNQRLDAALSAALPDMSRVQCARLIKETAVSVNGRPTTKPSFRVNSGDQITVSLPPVQETELVAEQIPLDIRYEDADMLAINKPAGMVVHPAPGHETGTLVNAVLGYCTDLAGIGGERRPGIVHRLDKDTSGLILIAKNDNALQHLQAQFKNRTIDKRYIALVYGTITPQAALIDAPIGRDPRQRKKMAVIPLNSSHTAREAQTKYQRLVDYGDYSLVSCHLLTGRTHQIRVHLAYAGYPIVGDTVYSRRTHPFPTNRHFLHAAELTFRRPSDNEIVHLKTDLPPELQKIITLIAE